MKNTYKQNMELIRQLSENELFELINTVDTIYRTSDFNAVFSSYSPIDIYLKNSLGSVNLSDKYFMFDEDDFVVTFPTLLEYPNMIKIARFCVEDNYFKLKQYFEWEE